ncbi:MAG: alpha/beta fold hydrolase [Planctomycetota bacterium]|nr:MAG: alpha/beta fold hydrolase [Planctomycetota bacterium]
MFPAALRPWPVVGPGIREFRPFRVSPAHMEAALPMLLLPGLLCDRALWQGLRPGLEEYAEVETLPSWECNQSLPQLADRLLNRLPDRFLLVGFSFGGYLALEMACRAPQRLGGLALLSTRAGPDRAEERRQRETWLHQARGEDFEDIVEAMLPRFLHPRHLKREELRESLRSMLLRNGFQTFLQQQKAMLLRRDWRPHLDRIQAPALVLCGQQDQVTPPDCSRAMASALTGAECHILPECGHFSPMERPRTVLARVQAWLWRCLR